jgi:hypothetical protein
VKPACFGVSGMGIGRKGGGNVGMYHEVGVQHDRLAGTGVLHGVLGVVADSVEGECHSVCLFVYGGPDGMGMGMGFGQG